METGATAAAPNAEVKNGLSLFAKRCNKAATAENDLVKSGLTAQGALKCAPALADAFAHQLVEDIESIRLACASLLSRFEKGQSEQPPAVVLRAFTKMSFEFNNTLLRLRSRDSGDSLSELETRRVGSSLADVAANGGNLGLVHDHPAYKRFAKQFEPLNRESSDPQSTTKP